jgi:hypothetical protein
MFFSKGTQESIRISDDDPSGKGDKTAFIASNVQEKDITNYMRK